MAANRAGLLIIFITVFIDLLGFAIVDELGISKSAAGVLSASYPAGTLLGALPGGWLAARVGVRPTTVLGLSIMGVSSIAFAFGHAQNPNVGTFGLVNIFLAGVLLSAAYLKTRSLWLPTMLHLGWNWGMASLLDLPVSGFELIDTPFYEPVVRGPEWLSGGGFGPEGGVAGSIGFAAALAALFLLKNVRVAEEMKALRPLPDG